VSQHREEIVRQVAETLDADLGDRRLDRLDEELRALAELWKTRHPIAVMRRERLSRTLPVALAAAERWQERQCQQALKAVEKIVYIHRGGRYVRRCWGWSCYHGGRWRRLFMSEGGWSVTVAGEGEPDFTALAADGWG
jgi:hypothetical protein